jgi:hypothetical protein
LSGGIFLHTSRDEIHWKLGETPIIGDFMLDSQNVLLYDPALKKYVYYFRGFEYNIDAKYGHRMRAVARGETENILGYQGIDRVEGDLKRINAECIFQ